MNTFEELSKGESLLYAVIKHLTDQYNVLIKFINKKKIPLGDFEILLTKIKAKEMYFTLNTTDRQLVDSLISIHMDQNLLSRIKLDDMGYIVFHKVLLPGIFFSSLYQKTIDVLDLKKQFITYQKDDSFKNERINENLAQFGYLNQKKIIALRRDPLTIYYKEYVPKHVDAQVSNNADSKIITDLESSSLLKKNN